MKKQNLNTALLAILACLLWSTAFVGIKIGLQYARPLSFAGMRFMLAGLLLFPFCIRSGNYFKFLKTHFKLIVTVALFQTFFLYALFYTGMTLVTGAMAAIVTGSSPLISAVTAHILIPDDRLTPSKIISIGTGLLGVILISFSRQPWSAAGLKECVGILLLLLCSTSSALGNITVARYKKPVSSMTLTSAQIFLGGCFLMILSLFLEGSPQLVYPLPFYPALLWLSFISAAAFSIWFMLLKRPGVRVSQLNIWKFILPIFGATFAWLLLPEESPDIFSVIGMICVAVSIIAFHYFSRNTGKMSS